MLVVCDTFKEAHEKVAWHLHKSGYHDWPWKSAMALAKPWIREGTEGDWPEHPGFSNEATGSDLSSSVKPTPSKSASPSPPSRRLRLAERPSPDRRRRERSRGRAEGGRDDIRSPPHRRHRPPPQDAPPETKRAAPSAADAPPETKRAAPSAATAAAPAVAGTTLSTVAPPAAAVAAAPMAGTPQEFQMVFFVCICPLPHLLARTPAVAASQLASPTRSLVDPPAGSIVANTGGRCDGPRDRCARACGVGVEIGLAGVRGPGHCAGRREARGRDDGLVSTAAVSRASRWGGGRDRRGAGFFVWGASCTDAECTLSCRERRRACCFPPGPPR